MRGVSITLSTIIVIIVLLITLIAVLSIFRGSFGSAGEGLHSVLPGSFGGTDFNPAHFGCDGGWRCMKTDGTKFEGEDSYTTYDECASVCDLETNTEYDCYCKK